MESITRYEYGSDGSLLQKSGNANGNMKDTGRDRVKFKKIPDLGAPIGESENNNKQSGSAKKISSLDFSSKGLVSGILYSEILGRPVSKKRVRR